MNTALTIDIGNTAIKLGLFDGDRLVRVGRGAPGDHLAELLHAIIGDESILRCGMASVVPATSAAVLGALQRLEINPVLVSHELVLPFEMGYRTPTTLGADRLAAAAGAWTIRSHSGAVVAIDAGTAVTYEVVDAAGVYRGGAIAPGPDLLRRALRSGTAQLPEIGLIDRPSPIGDSTDSAIQAGVWCGFVDAVAGMLHRIEQQLGERAEVMATGGWSAHLGREIPRIDAVDPHLVLKGIQALLALNSSAFPGRPG